MAFKYEGNVAYIVQIIFFPIFVRADFQEMHIENFVSDQVTVVSHFNNVLSKLNQYRKKGS
jgi:hypothetical protein